ncbi:ExeA family protein [Bremerella cremea]|uniref:ExeA family protein n=1 Tax=Bremerella cremea TaxID=1031537 RepID=UPI0031EC1202
MYEAYWKLKTRPFENTYSELFYYPSESAQAALLKLRYAVENRRGAAILAGACGLGKSLLVRTLMVQLPEQFSPKVHLVFPKLSSNDLIPYLLLNLGQGNPEGTAHRNPSETIWQLQQFLAENTRAGNHAVIVVDDAHLLSDHASLETLRLLTNFETDGKLDLTLILAGQTTVIPAVERFPSLESRIGVKSLMRNFTPDETAAYVTHRLRVAGSQAEIFAPNALERLFHITRGNPREINRLCDLALLIGYAEEIRQIDANQLESIHEELVTVVPE